MTDMGRSLILALDQGTTSTRAILFRPDGKAAGRGRAAAAPEPIRRTAGSSTTPRRSSPPRVGVLREAVEQRAGRRWPR